MNKDKFKKILDMVCSWNMAIHTQTTAPKASSKNTKRAIPKAYQSNLVDEEIDEEIDDSEENAARHKETFYPVVFKHFPIKTTCFVCENEVSSQVFDYKLKERMCVRKCSICGKSDEIRVIKKKMNK